MGRGGKEEGKVSRGGHGQKEEVRRNGEKGRKDDRERKSRQER